MSLPSLFASTFSNIASTSKIVRSSPKDLRRPLSSSTERTPSPLISALMNYFYNFLACSSLSFTGSFLVWAGLTTSTLTAPLVSGTAFTIYEDFETLTSGSSSA